MGLKKDIAKEYLDKFPDTPNLTLARKIYNENKEVYKNVDDARQRVRYLKGQHGKKDRVCLADKSHVSKPGEAATNLGIPNPYGLPESEEANWDAFELPKGKKYGVLSDVHIPYHSIGALSAALEYLDKIGVDGILLNGDTIDCYQLSRFTKDPRKRSFAQELEDTRTFLKSLKENFDVPLYVKAGNHSERYENFLKTKAPELLDIQEFRLDVILKFAEVNAQYITDRRIIKAGHLNILHGHEAFNSYSPVNPAKGHFNRTLSNIMVGHHHQTSEHTERTLDGRILSSWSTGCLCELHPQYMPINRWNHGFAVVNVESNGDFQVDNLRIYNGKVL